MNPHFEEPAVSGFVAGAAGTRHQWEDLEKRRSECGDLPAVHALDRYRPICNGRSRAAEGAHSLRHPRPSQSDG